MQRHMRRFGMVAVAVLAMGATAAEGQTAFVPQTDTHLTAETGPDARITDADGRTVLLRGINVVQIGDYFQNDPAQPARFDLTEQDFADIAASGCRSTASVVGRAATAAAAVTDPSNGC